LEGNEQLVFKNVETKTTYRNLTGAHFYTQPPHPAFFRFYYENFDFNVLIKPFVFVTEYLAPRWVPLTETYTSDEMEYDPKIVFERVLDASQYLNRHYISDLRFTFVTQGSSIMLNLESNKIKLMNFLVATKTELHKRKKGSYYSQVGRLGALLYELYFQALPSRDLRTQTYEQIQSHLINSQIHIPDDAIEVIASCLQARPERRPRISKITNLLYPKP
jgi:hypothetical protein